MARGIMHTLVLLIVALASLTPTTAHAQRLPEKPDAPACPLTTIKKDVSYDQTTGEATITFHAAVLEAYWYAPNGIYRLEVRHARNVRLFVDQDPPIEVEDAYYGWSWMKGYPSHVLTVRLQPIVAGQDMSLWLVPEDFCTREPMEFHF